MKQIFHTLRGVLLAGLLLTGLAGSAPACAGHEQFLGAVIGGGTGALIGDSMGGRDGAIIGGALGAVAGAALTQAHYRSPVVEYVPPPLYYRPPSVLVPAPVYYPRYDRDWERERWEQRRWQHFEHRREHNRDWDRDGYRR